MTSPSTWRRTDAKPEDWFDEGEVARSRTYMRPVKRMRLFGAVASGLITVVVIYTHLVPNLLRDWGVRGWVLQVAVAFAVLNVVDLPITIPRQWWLQLVHDKKWELSTQTPARFAGDVAKDLLVGTLLFTALMVPVYWAIRATSWWWLIGAAILTGVSLIVAFVQPVVIMPLFNKFVPVADPELAESIDHIAELAGTTIKGSFTMDASKRTRRDNAFVAGFGATKRVVIFDTMLEHPRASVEQVVAHELGHYTLKHIGKQIPLVVVDAVVVFGIMDVLLRWHWLLHRAGVRTLRDPGSLPLLIAVLGAGFATTSLVSAWVSRGFEREADLFALRLLQDPASFITTFRDMQTKNLMDLSPSLMTRAKASHPAVYERMAFAAEWARLNGAAINT